MNVVVLRGEVAAITGDTVKFCDGVAVAMNVTAVNPATVAVNWFVPGAGPSVQPPTVAMPELLVVCVAPVTEPPPIC